MSKWLATSWLVETKDGGLTPKVDGPFEIALESDGNGNPSINRDAIVFLMGLPKHLARPFSVLSFNWYDNDIRRMVEVWEGLCWIGNLYLRSCESLE